jgi:hypothetical protein
VAPSVVIDESIEQEVCLGGGAEGLDEPGISAEVDQREPMSH